MVKPIDILGYQNMYAAVMSHYNLYLTRFVPLRSKISFCKRETWPRMHECINSYMTIKTKERTKQKLNLKIWGFWTFFSQVSVIRGNRNKQQPNTHQKLFTFFHIEVTSRCRHVIKQFLSAMRASIPQLTRLQGRKAEITSRLRRTRKKNFSKQLLCV